MLVHIIAIALAFGMTVFVHELGHFLTARAFGMAVYEFSIGFGRPLLFWFKRGETQYSLRLWPFISYVRIAGMEPGDDHPQGFDKKPRWAQAVVMVWGGVMNFALGMAIFIVLWSILGVPIQATNRIEKVIGGTPAAKVGLQPGDRLVGLTGQGPLDLTKIRQAIRSHPDQPISLLIERGGRPLNVSITPGRTKQPEVKVENGKRRLDWVPVGQIGVVFIMKVKRLGPAQSIVAGFKDTIGMIGGLGIYLKGLVLGREPLALVGPVGVVDQLYTEVRASWYGFLSTAAALTIGIGFLNLLPIPPLDGSRVLILAIEAVRGRAFDKQKEIIVHVVGIALILALAIALTYKDILRVWGG